MSLFIVRHQHPADGCPAQDPFLGASLLNHMSRPNVRKFGLQIQGEAVDCARGATRRSHSQGACDRSGRSHSARACRVEPAGVRQ